ncbi:HNH endonuclease, partial [Streptomyces cavourensis]|nr:HNH endonuclease [Streptomyces cavourensis]
MIKKTVRGFAAAALAALPLFSATPVQAAEALSLADAV